MLSNALTRLNPFRPRPKRWPDFGPSLPWYDQADAEQHIARRRAEQNLNDADAELLQKWASDGYVILPKLVDEAVIDRMCDDVDALWHAQQPFPDLQIEEVRRNKNDPHGMSHADLLAIPRDEREQMRRQQRWRVHGYYRFSDSTRAVFQHESVRRICSLLFDQEAVPHYSINFMYGSRQELHQDTAVFHVFPANHLIGAWIACEDISADSGPLVYYPGSQKIGLFRKFDNYPQTNLRTCSLLQTYLYNRQLNKAARGFERRQFLARKGDVLLWNGLLIHGGDAVVNPALSRKSFVVHYIPQGMDRSQQVSGPFNWG
jgi:hypothetical protein